MADIYSGHNSIGIFESCDFIKFYGILSYRICEDSKYFVFVSVPITTYFKSFNYYSN